MSRSAFPIKYLFRVQRRLVEPSELGDQDVFHYSLPAWHETGDGRIEPARGIASTKLLLSGGEILVSKLNPEKGAVIHARRHDMITVCSTEFIVLVPLRGMISERFTYYLMLSSHVRRLLEESVESATMSHKRARVERFLSAKVQVPDIESQKRIADFLDRETARIDQLIEKKRRLVEVLQEKRESFASRVVLEGFNPGVPHRNTSSPYVPEIPAHWSLVRLKQIATVRGGIALGRALPGGARTVTVPYLRVANVQAGWLDLTDVATMTITEDELERFRLEPGDVLMLEGGDNDKLGRGTVWNGEIDPCVHQNHVFVVQPREKALAEWISLCSNARYGRDFFFLNSRQSTNLASIAKSRLEEFPIPMPPLEERLVLIKKIKGHQSQLDHLMRAVTESVGKLQELRSSLIAAAVTGQVDVDSWHRRRQTDRVVDEIESNVTGT